MKTGFITFSDFHGRAEVGSSRIRARWLCEKWGEAGPDIGEAELFRFGAAYDCVIYQKAYWWEHAEEFGGVKILDLCDPDFLHWGYPIRRMIEACHAVVCSTERLAAAVADFAGGKPVHFVPDCVSGGQPRKTHRGPVRSVAWFGYPENFAMINSAAAAIAKRRLELIVVSSRPYVPPPGVKLELRNLPWTAETWVDDFMRADVVINPRSDEGRFAFKSDNKTVQAWACGVPVASNDVELDEIIALSPEARQALGDERREWVAKNRDVRRAVELMKKIIIDAKDAFVGETQASAG